MSEDQTPEEKPDFDVEAFMRTVTTRPGVYRMFNEHEEIIYVGKASNLKNRLSSYFQKTLDNRKTQALVSHIANVQTTVTTLSLIHI